MATTNIQTFSGDVEVTSNILMSGEVFIKANDGNGKVGIGLNAGATSQGASAVAVGVNAGVTSQGASATALGVGAGSNNQGGSAVAVGNAAGQTSQGGSAVAVGYLAGLTSQGGAAVAVGLQAGRYNQGNDAVAVGLRAAETSQGSAAVAVGKDAGGTSQGTLAVAVGNAAGYTSQGNSATALGVNAGQTSQGASAVAVGQEAGQTAQGNVATALGRQAGRFNQGYGATAVGWAAGVTSQGSSAVAVGALAGQTCQSQYATAVGHQAGLTCQGYWSVAIGTNAGYSAQGSYTVAIGGSAGFTSQSAYGVALGHLAGSNNQGFFSVAVGTDSGTYNQGSFGVAAGYLAGQYNQDTYATAVGNEAGQYNQGVAATAVGLAAGRTSQGDYAVAMGYNAGNISQGDYAVAVGRNAGQTSQGISATAVGNGAGNTSQGAGATAVGSGAGNTSQGLKATAVGEIAGYTSQGFKAVALGHAAGYSNQGSEAIAVGANAGQYNQPAESFFTRYDSVRGLSGTRYEMFIGTTGEIQKNTSDDRLKHDEKFITGAVNSLCKLRPQEYLKRQKLDATDPEQSWSYEAGLMAQEVYYSAPELRHIVQIPPEAGDVDSYTPPPSDDPTQDPDYSAWGNDVSTVEYKQLTPYLVKAVQEIVTELPRSKTTVSNAWGQNITGRIVSANANAHKTNTTPIVALSNVYADKTWYGVVSNTTTDTNDYDTLVDTKGDTQIWVTDTGGPLESGDLVTTSNVAPGYAQKQGHGALMNYTVAKVTQDCDFTEPTQRPIRVPKRELSNVTYYRHDASYEISLEKYENVPTFKTRVDETTIYFKEVTRDSNIYTETRYYEGDTEVSEQKYNTLPEDSRSIKHLSEISVDDYGALDDEAKASYSIGIKKRYFILNYSKSKTQIPQHDEEVIVEELVDVLDENGQIVWEETGETEPVYTLVDHGSYKAALVSAKLV
ncbi:hypothetical protein OtV5_071 [Ostreococcus tauri virus OtV5]|uniref:Peptidase S74 domain-containing protein n=1 Tax=Ostreococcus tauri virus OtV5 TaxID=1785753 RepID=A9YVX8_9PHYC|nr:hypothetical protein OtV5_071 [Ostreococcus tauri virus OtV5]ABY27861.2 hypothetical protein OtV5_071 [Ostreococcus tauri virus OtV5]